MLWRILFLLFVAGQVLGEVCPGGKVKCPERMTCCPLANHDYGCCTYPEAQCCNDHVHCCPNGMKCDTQHQACLKNGFPAVFFAETSIKAELVTEVKPTDTNLLQTNHINEDESNDKNCPDGHQCPNSFTCCKMYRGSYGCCPYTNAKCCMDGFHCCPHGSECDPTTGGCEYDGNWLGKAASLIKGKPLSTPEKLTVADPGGKCPDGHPCLEKYTCCKVQDGGYGCCPYTDAVCCTDLIHCCPKSTNCNNSLGTCDVGEDYSIPLYSLTTLKLSHAPALSGISTPANTVSNDICPDRRSKCKHGNTCCQTRDGSYACCPMEEGTCCSENESCCPKGYQCAPGGMCKRVSLVAAHPFFPSVAEKQKPTAASASEIVEVKEDYVHCPDGSLCPDGNTCCQVSRARYGCCPMPRATCCGDMQHCCPYGTWCAEGGCERLDGTLIKKSVLAFSSFAPDYHKVMLAP